VITLHQRLDDYLALRRALGFKLEREGHLLPDFVDHLQRHGAPAITAQLALDWAKQPLDGHPAWWAQRLTLVRGFAEHLYALDPRTEVPPRDLLPARVRRATPYLYSEQDVCRLIAAAGALSPLRAESYATLIGLLSVTGMRVGEAIALDRTDFDEVSGVVVVRFGKFGRSREIPLHDSTVGVLRAYARFRDCSVPAPRSPSFFLSSNGTRLIYKNAHHTFRRLVQAAGLQPRSSHCRPRIHDLRHTFAVRTLVDWYRAGLDVDALLPRLSTYLGHVSPVSTYWYLSASPELFALAAERVDRMHRARS